MSEEQEQVPYKCKKQNEDKYKNRNKNKYKYRNKSKYKSKNKYTNKRKRKRKKRSRVVNCTTSSNFLHSITDDNAYHAIQCNTMRYNVIRSTHEECL